MEKPKLIKYCPINKDSAVERIDFYKDDKKITLVNRFDVYKVYAYLNEDDFDMVSYNPSNGAI